MICRQMGSPNIQGCTDVSPNTPTDCEVAQGRAVLLTANSPIEDIVIGSVQANEQFQIRSSTSTDPGTLSDLTTLTFATCTPAGTDQCHIELPAGTFAVGLVVCWA